MASVNVNDDADQIFIYITILLIDMKSAQKTHILVGSVGKIVNARGRVQHELSLWNDISSRARKDFLSKTYNKNNHRLKLSVPACTSRTQQGVPTAAQEGRRWMRGLLTLLVQGTSVDTCFLLT